MSRAYGRAALIVAVAAMLLTAAHAQQKGWYNAAGGHVQSSPLLADLNGDQRLEILTPSFDDKLYVYNHDGTIYNPGSTNPWPKTMGLGSGTIGSASVGDINGDGNSEIVILGNYIQSEAVQNATLKVYQPDGTQLISNILNASATGKATPCLIDCYRYSGTQAHSAKEILVRDGDGRVHILHWSDGSAVDHYDPLYFDTCSTAGTASAQLQRDRYGSQPINPSVAALSLDSTRTLVVVGSTNNSLYRWEIASSPNFNWTVNRLPTLHSNGSTDTCFLSSPALVDLEGDGSYEIIAGASNHEVYVWNQNGALRAGWPQITTQAIISSPAAANLDDDPQLEIVIGCDNGVVYVWNPDGSTLSGWSDPLLMTMGDVFSSPVIGEIDGVAGLEIVATSLDGHIYAWNNMGALLSGWPKRMNTPLYGAPAIGDLHHSGRQAIVAAGYDGKVFVWDLKEKALDTTAGWLQFRGGSLRQGHP